MILTRRELDVLRCAEPGCDHDHSVLFLHSACHPESNVGVRYVKATHTLIVACGICEKQIAEVAVA